MIRVEHDGSGPEDGNEQCCFCYRATRYWYAHKDVAVCPSCAEVRQPSEVPSKEQWCADIMARNTAAPQIQGVAESTFHKHCAYEGPCGWACTPAPQPHPVPNGWKLVPIKPTQNMMDDADRARALPELYIEEIWQAMVAASPAPQLHSLPPVNAKFETNDGVVIGSTDAKIKRVETEDDGSITVVIDHWPKT